MTGQSLLAYFAGLFDGEGCIHAHFIKDNKGETPRSCVKVTLSMVHPGAVRMLFETYGGSLKSYPGKGINRTKWCWWLGQRASAKFLEDLLPYLVVKKEEAVLALELCARIKLTGKASKGHWGTLPIPEDEYIYRATLVNQIRSLKRQEFLN